MSNSLRKIAAVLLVLSGALFLHAQDVILSFNADGHNVLTVDVAAGGTYRLDSILTSNSVTVGNCRGYNFIGWKIGGPVEGDENPTANPTTYRAKTGTVSPTANTSLYAVYQKPGASGYKRITSTRDLHAGEQYVLACYYEWDGDVYYGPSYFAMRNVEEETSLFYRTGDSAYIAARDEKCALYSRKYLLRTSQVYPDAGYLDNPAANIRWTLGGTEDAWTLTSVATPAQSLKISSNFSDAAYLYDDALYEYTPDYNQHLLANPGNTFAITAANGAFNFRADNGYYLSYSEDDEDYFITKTGNTWSFYLYKKESAYTSFPNCEDWTLRFDAADGTVGNTGEHTYDIEESTPGAGIILPTATKPTGTDCSGWTFVGWSSETPIQGTSNDITPGLHTAGTLYHPAYNGETLYAVFSKSETITKYVKATSSPLANGTYLIVVKDGDHYYPMGNVQERSTPWDNSYHYYGVFVTTTDVEVFVNTNGEIIGAVSNKCEWNWTSNNSRFRNAGNNVYVNPNYSGKGNPYTFNVVGNNAVSLSLRLNGELWAISNGNNRLVYSNGEFFNQYNSGSDYPMFYLFKKTTDYITTYTSYPHCTEYTITLNACGGTIGGIAGKVTDVMTEEGIGTGFTLPTCEPRCSDDGWEFYGWLEGDDLAAVEEVDFTGLHTGHYVPSRDGIKLYAVYRRILDRFQIIYGPDGIVSGDTYLITDYAKESEDSEDIYDWMLSGTSNGSNLTAVKAGSPQNNEGYYIEVSDSAQMWVITSAGNYWNFQNLETGRYLSLNTNGTTSTTVGANTIVTQDYDGLAMFIYNTNIDVLYCDFENLAFKTENGVGHRLYVYRRAKEFTSWPHCETEKFTVNFDAGNGTAGATSLTETEAYAGVVLPDAYVNSDCSKEGWTFAGWATSPIREESDALSVDLYPGGSLYHLTSNNSTLYAVYCIKENTYRKLGAVADLRLGVNYIIATDENKALGGTLVPADTAITAINVSPSANVITNPDAVIEWRLQGRAGEYVLYNILNDVYLDLRTARQAHLTATAEDNFLISYVSGSFRVHSNQSIVGYAAPKYLSYSATASGFNTADRDNLSTLYFYQQEALYHSSPSCVCAVDAVLWEKKADGNYVTVESYLLSGEPIMTGAIGHATSQAVDQTNTAQDGTWLIKYTDTELAPGSTTPVDWNGQTATLKIPYIVDEDTTTNKLLGAGGNHSSHDVVVMSGKKLTVDENRTLHTVTLQEGATLEISDGDTLTVKALVLGANGDQAAPKVNLLGNSSSIVLKNDELYYDLRIPADRYYWYALPFDSRTQEISYSNVAANGGMPTYYEDFWVYYYDGASRAADANSGSLKPTYWTEVAEAGGDYTMRYGQGYLIGITNQNEPQLDGRVHTKRVMRFTMRPPEATWLVQERDGGGKVGTVTPSTVTDIKQAYNAGWNLIGNPYMHDYGTGMSGGGGLRNGAWKKDSVHGVWNGKWKIDSTRTITIPYLTIFNPSTQIYTQVPAANYTFRPFEAIFVQVEAGTGLNFTTNMNVSSAPAYMRFVEPDEPVYTGIALEGMGRKDKTGFVIYEEYSTHYEIGADLAKYTNSGHLNLYSFNADNQQLAFNGLNEEDALNPIPLGVTFPAAGEYTFSLDNEWYDANQIESIILIDNAEQERVNLKNGYYTFTTNAGVVDNRFSVIIQRVEEVTTDIEPVGREQGQPYKIIRDGKLFIIRDNEIYNATGVRVR